MKKTIFITSVMGIILLSVSLPFSAEGNTPTAGIQTTVNAIIDTLRDEKLAPPGKKEEKRSRIRALIRDRFDFEEMAKRSLALHWRERTPEERKEFVSLFAELLEASYIGRIESYTDEKVTYDKEEIKKGTQYAVVDTTILTQSVNIPIQYKVILKNNKWWVYDVLIEGVSFVSTYRSQYNKIIKRESYAHLVQKMKDKLEEVNALSEKDDAAQK